MKVILCLKQARSSLGCERRNRHFIQWRCSYGQYLKQTQHWVRQRWKYNISESTLYACIHENEGECYRIPNYVMWRCLHSHDPDFDSPALDGLGTPALQSERRQELLGGTGASACLSLRGDAQPWRVQRTRYFVDAEEQERGQDFKRGGEGIYTRLSFQKEELARLVLLLSLSFNCIYAHNTCIRI